MAKRTPTPAQKARQVTADFYARRVWKHLRAYYETLPPSAGLACVVRAVVNDGTNGRFACERLVTWMEAQP